MKREAKRQSADRRLSLEPPPKLPDEVEELFAADDFEELEYRRMAELRRLEKLTPEQRQILVAHDATERRIEQNPNDVMRESQEAIDRGTSLLLKLVRSASLARRYADKDGSILWESDDAFECLKSRLDYLNRQLVRLADKGTPGSRATVFYQAKALTEAFIQLAQAHPKDFIPAAESSLTMPSLRARNPKYTADAEAIASSIHLAEKHPVKETPNDKERIGELCGQLVAEILESIASARQYYKDKRETLKRLQNFHESADEYRGVTIEEFLRPSLYPTSFEDVIACAAMPEFHDDPQRDRERMKTCVRPGPLRLNPTRSDR